MNIKKPKNEATLEARIAQVLQSTFPTFKEVGVIHQQSFSIKLGHHNVLVDLKEPKKHPTRAIFDILLTIDGQNTILLELKKEGLKLTENDISQGISYARLTHPMPPITLISNGQDNLFYNTYTKEKLEENTLDITYLKALTDNSFQLATNDFKDAVKLLLNKEPELFAKVVNQISVLRFNRLIGEINDFTKSITKEFSIERDLVEEIWQKCQLNQSLIGVIAPAFSGKTNLLYQFFEKSIAKNGISLYFNCLDYHYGILQYLANHFSKETKTSIKKDQIREWIINAFNDISNTKFYLLLDNFNNEIPEHIKSEIIELIDLFDGHNHNIIYTTDEFNYQKIAFFENRRYKTLIGEKSIILKLNELSDKEYDATRLFLFNNFRAEIDQGGHYAPEYRQLRILRHFTGLYKNQIPKNKIAKIDAVPGYRYLQLMSQNKIYHQRIHELYEKITHCFFLEYDKRKKIPELNVAAYGSGAITTDIFKETFLDEYDSLIKSTFIVTRTLSNGLKIIYPKIPELISLYAINYIKSKLINSKSDKNTSVTCNQFINLTRPIPYCDIVGCGVLIKIAHAQEIDLFSNLVLDLLELPPKKEKINAGTKVLMYVEDKGNIQIEFENDDEEHGFMSNFFPFSVLSQLGSYPLRIVDNKSRNKPNYTFHREMLEILGSSPHFIRKPDARSFSNWKPMQSWDIEDVGTIVSGREGIIEPIVQSINECFIKIPKQIKLLYNKGFKENNILLIWRCYLALRQFTNISDAKLSKQAKGFMKAFNPFFKNFMNECLTKNIVDEDERKKILEVLRNMNNNPL